MERQPYNTPGESSSKDGKDKKTSGGFEVVRPPLFRSEAQRPAERHHVPAAPAIEGIISWRDRAGDDLHERQDVDQHLQQQDQEDNKPEDKKDAADKSAKKPQQPPKAVEQQPERPSPRPLDEVIAETIRPVIEHKPDVAKEPADESKAALPPDIDRFSFPMPPAPVESVGDFPPVTASHEHPASEGGREDANDTRPWPRPDAPRSGWEVAAPGDPVSTEAYDPETPAAETATMPVPVAAEQQYDPARVPNPDATPDYMPAPAQPGYHVNHAAFGPYDPNSPGFGYSNPNVMATPPVMPIEHPRLAHNANRDPRVGPLAALLGLEYLARKRAGRKLEKRLGKQSRQQMARHEQTMNANYRRTQEQQRQLAAEQQRQGREMQRMRFGAPVEAQPAATIGIRPFESAPSVMANTRSEQGSQRSLYHHQETAPAQPFAQPDRSPVSNIIGGGRAPEQYRSAGPSPEQMQENESASQENMAVNPGQHVEHSSWHNIVVDERGHEVVGAIQYGEGFQGERQQEAIRDRFAAASQNNGTHGSVGYAQQGQQYGNPALPSGMTRPTLPQGPSTHADPQHQLSANNQQPSNLTNPWLWIMLLLIIAAFFTAAFI